MTTYFFTTWGPLVFESMGFSRETAAYTRVDEFNGRRDRRRCA